MNRRFSPFTQFLLVNCVAMCTILAFLGANWTVASANVAGAILGTAIFGWQVVVSVAKGRAEPSKRRSVVYCIAALVMSLAAAFVQPLVGLWGAAAMSTAWVVISVMTVQYAWLTPDVKPQRSPRTGDNFSV